MFGGVDVSKMVMMMMMMMLMMMMMMMMLMMMMIMENPKNKLVCLTLWDLQDPVFLSIEID